MRLSALPVILIVSMWLPGCTPVEGTETPDEAALDFLAALDAGDHDRAWDRTTGAYREPWTRHIEEAGRDPGIRRPVSDHWIPEEIEERLGAGELGEITPRELFRRVGIQFPMPPSDSPFTIELDADGHDAEVIWKEESLAVGLRREGRRWLVTHTRLLVTDARRGDPHPGIALPRLPGDRLVLTREESGPSYALLSVAADGSATLSGRTYGPGTLALIGRTGTIECSDPPKTLEEGLVHCADFHFGDPATRRPLHIGAHRDAAWSDVETVLRTANRLSFRDVQIITRVGRWKDHGVPIRLAELSQQPPGPGLPLVEVVGTIREGRFVGLLAALRARPQDGLRSGVRVRMAPGLRSEDGFRALSTMTAAGVRRVFIEDPLPGGMAPPGVRLDGQTIGSRAGSVPAWGDETLHLVLR